MVLAAQASFTHPFKKVLNQKKSHKVQKNKNLVTDVTPVSASTANKDWMKNLPDTIDIRAISAPGTHDTMALHDWCLLGSVETQVLTLAEQLDLGIRYTDIRLVCVENGLESSHNIVYEWADLSDVFTAY